jgi:hypothetical protein
MVIKRIVFILLFLTVLCFLAYKVFSCEFLVLARTDMPREAVSTMDFSKLSAEKVDSFKKNVLATGNIIVVKDNKAVWGSDELDKSKFYIIVCSDMKVEEGLSMKDDYYFDIKFLDEKNLETITKEEKLYLTPEGIVQCFFKK